MLFSVKLYTIIDQNRSAKNTKGSSLIRKMKKGQSLGLVCVQLLTTLKVKPEQSSATENLHPRVL